LDPSPNDPRRKGPAWSRLHIEFPPELPISARAGEIVDAIGSHPVIILAGETGSGKTTQIPKMCLAAGRGRLGRIACTQPRRVAALSLSRRVAEEIGVTWGREVGCKVRFSDETTPQTVIKFLTDGMLLAEAQGDPLLRDYDTIVVDEAHERSLNIDFLLGHLRQLRFQRPELRIIITSATIDTEAFSKAFEGAPVILVEGRMYPVEVVYSPLDSFGSDATDGDETRAEAMHYVDGAVEAAERIARDSASGDVLVFMPSERDIRETCELLGPRLRGWEIVSLYGRMSNDEQRRVFAPGQRRRVIVATNIAETSLTIPGIRFVVDTGLVRLSRYSPQARTRRLPIEAISQSSADQRKGRCGRVAEGVCIRLYSEEDYLARPRFTQPEIQRANLADVILRLKAHGFGDVERFPFISPPSTKAIRAGYVLLEELGALEPGSSHTLTSLGRELARLPVDPTVGRMILQASGEKALSEVLVIASGLSIQDPRERPAEKREQADAAHRRFAHPDSDFLTLLRIWEAYHGDVESMSQGRLRAFCRSHHLSYLRMREWRDIHAQLLEVVGSRDGARMTSVFDGVRPNADRSMAFATPAYRAIHRSILAGLLGNIAHLDEENGGYRAAHGRHAALFPGSVLFRRDCDTRREKAPARTGAPKRTPKAPRWIMAAEITETARLFARTCARMDPLWVLDIGAHILNVSHSEPSWDADMGRVMVKRRTRLYGVEIECRSVGFGPIDPVRSTEIFIREGLVNDTVTWPFDFIAHNRRLREKVEALLARTRDGGYLNLDEAAYGYYASRLPPVSSVAELVDIVRERRANEPRYLMMEEGDLRDTSAVDPAAHAFPEAVPIENRAIPLNYAYKPGEEDDGVTLEVNARDARLLTAGVVDSAVPGHLGEKVEHYLRALPKERRRLFVPLKDHALRLAKAIGDRAKDQRARETVAEALSGEVRRLHGIWIDPSDWSAKPLPEHLRVRVRIVDDKGREVAADRDLVRALSQLEARERGTACGLPREDAEAWGRARERHERGPQAVWGFGDIPERVVVSENAGVHRYGYLGLKAEAGGVALRLFGTPQEASAATEAALSALLALQLGRDLAWLHRDLRVLAGLGPLLAMLKPSEELREDAFESVSRWLCSTPVRPLTEAAFGAALADARQRLVGIVPRLVELVREIASLSNELLVSKDAYPGLAGDLERLLPRDFIRTTPFAQLAHFPRYLRAMKLRSAKRRQNPARDDERSKELAPFAAAAAQRKGEFRWLVEEFRVSLFAQELGTAVPVSKVKLAQALCGETAPAREPEAQGSANPKPSKPAPRAPEAPAARKAPLKSLSSLDKALQ
jgi:ATP-dependent helicase HrpA